MASTTETQVVKALRKMIAEVDDDAQKDIIDGVVEILDGREHEGDPEKACELVVDLVSGYCDADSIDIRALCDKVLARPEAEAEEEDGDDKKGGKTRKDRKKEQKERMRQAALAAQAEDQKDAAATSAATAGPMPVGDDIIIRNFTIYMRGNALLKGTDLTLVHGHRYGLVGYNGSGKSTLLKHIAQREGEFRIPEHIDVLYVEQEVTPTDKSALQTVMEADLLRTKLLAEQREIEGRDARVSDEQRELDSVRLGEIYAELEEINAGAAEARASAILSGLQFDEEMKARPTKHFSGGWRMRVSLARALFLKPRLLLLDEPTNHLDLHAVLWLESYLRTWKNTLLVVSHDRDFLSGVTTDTIHLWMNKLVPYKGNFDAFEKIFATKLQEYKTAYEKQQQRLKALKRSGKVTTNVSKTSSRETKGKRDQRDLVTRGTKTTNAGGKAGKPGDGDDEDEGQLLQPLKDYQVKIEFQDGGDLPSPLLQLEELMFQYGPDKPVLFKGVNFGIHMDSRIALVGPNGTGKSTLLKLMSGELQPTRGLVIQNRKMRIGVFSQHFVDQLNMDMNPIEYIQSKFGDMQYQEVRKYLGTIGLGGSHHEQKISTLSGGQKARVMLVELQLRAPHILLLDEPTNNLDMETIDALSEALQSYNGGVVLVTHNIYLISSACKEIYLCGEDASVKQFRGDFDEYKTMLQEQLQAEEDARTAARTSVVNRATN